MSMTITLVLIYTEKGKKNQGWCVNRKTRVNVEKKLAGDLRTFIEGEGKDWEKLQ